MKDLFIARQPIYNKELNVLGYELLYRNGNVSNAIFDDGKKATSETILNAFMDIGIDTLAGSALAFINLPIEFIIDDSLMPLFTEQSVLEILEDIEPTTEVVLGIKRLKENGYKIALDDFCYDDKFIPFLELADFVKIDVLEFSESELKKQVELVSLYPVKLIAEKVETQIMKELCENCGFDYFQGYFYCKPQTLSHKKLLVNKSVTVNLLSKVQDPNTDIEELQRVLSQDVVLSYKLLRYINSAMFSLRRDIDSIKDAVVLLGKDNVKKWLSLILLSEMETNKPDELISVALTRAKMCESLAEKYDPEIKPQMFIIGLFSVLDALMDTPMIDLLDTVILSISIKMALLDYEGTQGEILKLVLAYEKADCSNINQLSISTKELRDCYVESVVWARESMNSLTD